MKSEFGRIGCVPWAITAARVTSRSATSWTIRLKPTCVRGGGDAHRQRGLPLHQVEHRGVGVLVAVAEHQPLEAAPLDAEAREVLARARLGDDAEGGGALVPGAGLRQVRDVEIPVRGAVEPVVRLRLAASPPLPGAAAADAGHGPGRRSPSRRRLRWPRASGTRDRVELVSSCHSSLPPSSFGKTRSSTTRRRGMTMSAIAGTRVSELTRYGGRIPREYGSPARPPPPGV